MTQISIDDKLEQLGQDPSEIERNLYVICDRYGPRFAGSDNYRRAAEHMLGRFKDYGLDDAQLEPFEFTAFRRGEPAQLQMTRPFSETIACYALPYGGNAGPGGIEADVVDVGGGTTEQMEALQGDLAGSFALVTEPGRHRMEIFEDCVRLKAAGMVLCNRAAGNILCSGSVTDAIEGEIPAVSIGRESGLKLQRLARRDSIRFHLTVNNRFETDVTWNVVGELRGTEHPDELVIVGGHLDSHEIGPGAYDNAAGAVTVAEIARMLAAHRDQLKRTVRFICFGAEEVGLLGSRYHAQARAAELADARLMFNCDMPAMNKPWGLVLHRCPQAEHFVTRLAEQLSMDLPCRHVTHAKSDHYPFTLLGIPAMALAGTGPKVGTMGFGHMAGDTPERIPVDCLCEAAAFSARVILRAANDEQWPG
jgi:hypothetical protein